MDREEAKFILSALRSRETGEHSDSQVTEALQLVETDEVLRDWFREIRQFDSIMRTQFQTISVPPDLKTNILTGIKVSRKPGISRRFIAGILTIAAALVAAFIFWQINQKVTVADFQRDMLEKIEALEGIDHVSSDPASISTYLEQEGVPLDFPLESQIEGLTLAGCKVIDWKGHRVSLICLNSPSPDLPLEIHFMTISAGAIKHLEAEQEEAMTINEWSSTVWRSGNQVRLLAVKNAEGRDLRKLIPLG